MAQKFRKRTGFNPSLSIEDAFKAFIYAKSASGLSPATIRTYQTHFKAISRFKWPNVPFVQVASYDLSALISRMVAAGLSRNSVRSYTATLKTFFSWARSEGLTDLDVPLYRGEETIKEIYTDAELQRLLRHPPRYCPFGELRNWAMVTLLVGTGVRASTARSIRVGDVDLKNSVITLRHMKAGVLQSVPISPSLDSTLREYMKERGGDPDEFLFCDIDGGQMSPVCLRAAIRRYNFSRGVKKTGIHAFRHTFARLYLVECGGDALKLQKLLGHSTLDMTKHYVRIYSTDLVKEFQIKAPLEAIKKDPPSGERMGLPCAARKEVMKASGARRKTGKKKCPGHLN